MSVMTLEELLAQPADSAYYLSRPLIPRGGRIIIGAPAKHFKSMLALNLAYQLAEGEPLWKVQKPDGSPLWIVRKPLTVLYVEKEIGKYRLKERLHRMHGAMCGELATDNLYLEPKGNEIDLDSPNGTRKLCEMLTKIQPDVLVLDPLRKFHSQDEDSSTDMKRITDSLDFIQREYKDLTAIIVHHTGKRSEWRNPTQPEALRGTSLIFDDADSLIMVDRPIKTDEKTIRLHFVLRSAEDPKPVTLRFDAESFVFGPKKEVT